MWRLPDRFRLRRGRIDVYGMTTRAAKALPRHLDQVMTKTVILGPEYDERLQATVMDVMLALGASIDDRTGAIAGSQEIETVRARLAGQEITIEAETYVGLSITGGEKAVDDIAARVRLAARSVPT